MPLREAGHRKSMRWLSHIMQKVTESAREIGEAHVSIVEGSFLLLLHTFLSKQESLAQQNTSSSLFANSRFVVVQEDLYGKVKNIKQFYVAPLECGWWEREMKLLILSCRTPLENLLGCGRRGLWVLWKRGKPWDWYLIGFLEEVEALRQIKVLRTSYDEKVKDLDTFHKDKIGIFCKDSVSEGWEKESLYIKYS